MFTFFLYILQTENNYKHLSIMFGLRTQEILFIVLIILLLFGAKKIPELMKGLGKGVKSFKQGMNEALDEDEKPVAKDKKQDASADNKEA
jgi:sec-independent protein translocase protein TatA